MRNIVCLAVLIFSNITGYSQLSLEDTSIVINSLEGEPAVIYIIPDYINKKLTIQLSSSEAIYFTNFLSIKQIKIIDKFIAVSFEQYMLAEYNNPDAEKITFVKTMLFCVSNGHLYNAMNDMPDTKGFSLQHDKNGDYQVIETEHERYASLSDSGKAQEFFDTVKYNFDKTNKVFYQAPEFDRKMDEDKPVVINSLEDKQETLHIKAYYPEDMLTIELSSSEIMRCNEFIGIKKIKKYDKFIYIEYIVRCGSNCGEGKTVFVCVSNGHLYNALDITSHQDYDMSQVYDRDADSLGLFDEHGLFQVHFSNLQIDKSGGNELTATQYEKVKNKHDFLENHETLDTLKFNFDKKNKVFYNRYVTLQGNYTIESESGNKEKVFTGGKYPVIELKNHGQFFSSYVFMDGHWYNNTENGNHILYGPIDVSN